MRSERLDEELSLAIAAVRDHMGWKDFEMIYRPHVEVEATMENEGGWDWEAQTVWIPSRLLDDPKERRITLLHEAVHIWRSDRPGEMTAKDHTDAERIAQEIYADELDRAEREALA